MGDSATQVMTPLNPYMVVLLAMLRKYEPGPRPQYSHSPHDVVVPFWAAWTVILMVFYFFNLPLGPGVGIMIEQ